MEIESFECDYYYHVYNRSINRQRIFTSELHYYKFLELCSKYLPRFAEVYAYCLIPNHFHFLLYVNTYPDNIPPYRMISHLCNAYAQWFNKITDRTGGLFQRPFRRIKIINQDYLKQVIYYIHTNPLHHNLVADLSKYRFSSYLEIIGNQPTVTKREQVLEWFGGKENLIKYHNRKFDDLTEILLEEE